MRNGICRNCNSDSVYAAQVAGGDDFRLPAETSLGFLGSAVVLNAVPTERYVCVACGYVEVYVADRRILSEIARSAIWKKV